MVGVPLPERGSDHESVDRQTVVPLPERGSDHESVDRQTAVPLHHSVDIVDKSIHVVCSMFGTMEATIVVVCPAILQPRREYACPSGFFQCELRHYAM